MLENSPPPGAMNGPGNGQGRLIDPQATFNVFAMVILSGAMLVTPFIRLKVGSRYFVGMPTVGAFFGLLFIAGYARSNLDRGLFLLTIYAWLTWIPVRIVWAGLRSYRAPIHSHYNGWPILCTLFRGDKESLVKLLIEPGICFALSIPWAHKAPVFSGLLFFVGLCLLAAHGMANHLVSRRSQSLIDAEIEERTAIADFRQRRGRR